MQHRWLIHFRLDMRHITAVLIFVPVERQCVDFVVLPGVNSFQCFLAPVEAFVFSEISGAVDKDNEAFILRLYETLPYPVPDELTERVVI